MEIAILLEICHNSFLICEVNYECGMLVNLKSAKCGLLISCMAIIITSMGSSPVTIDNMCYRVYVAI